MAEPLQEKSNGLTFAERQMTRHGWEKGKGLGREENGISEAIKVKVKCDKGGVGHREGEQFSFHWWDHVFNKASASLEVESDQNGVQVKKLPAEEEEEEGMISNKKPRKASLAKAKLYGCFVKSATLLAGQEQPEQKSSSSDSDDDARLDLSSTTKLSDAELMRACGGLTAHKGGRHGITMSAKLARLQQQEREFMDKYGKKSQPLAVSPVTATPAPQGATQSPEGQAEEEESLRKKKKKKRKASPEDGPHETAAVENAAAAVCESPDAHERKKKKKKKMKEGSKEDHGEVGAVPPAEVGGSGADAQPTKRKRQKKRLLEESGVLDGEGSRGPVAAGEREAGGGEEPEEDATQQQTDTDADTRKKKKKKKKKKNEKKSSKNQEDSPAVEERCTDAPGSGRVDAMPEEKQDGDASTGLEGEEEPRKKRRKKRCKEDKQTVEDVDTASLKKKTKKTKDKKMELE